MFELFNKNKITSSNNLTNKPLKVYDVSENKCLKEDIIVFRYFVLKLFDEINKGMGMTNLVKILKGSHKDYKNISVSGSMKKYKNEDIKNYIRKINHSEYISRKSIPGNDRAIYYCMNDFGKNWLKYNDDDIKLSSIQISKVQAKYKKYLNNKIKHKITTSPFYAKLIKWRDTKAKELKKPKYCILNNKIIEDIILNAPTNNKELLKIKGIGPKK